jgi:crotonobetainyl-CoA:carnitine CoA-transferase CaiB-like acyl-CoA transferase
LPELVERIESVTSTLTTAEIVHRLDAAQVPCGPIYTVPEVFADPQVQHLELHQRIPHPTLGMVDQTGFPWRFSQTPARIRRYPPLLGEHTEEVLGELGYTSDEITAMRQQGAV